MTFKRILLVFALCCDNFCNGNSIVLNLILKYVVNHSLLQNVLWCMVWDHFVYASSQWEMMLYCNIISHWLDAYMAMPDVQSFSWLGVHHVTWYILIQSISWHTKINWDMYCFCVIYSITLRLLIRNLNNLKIAYIICVEKKKLYCEACIKMWRYRILSPPFLIH